MGKIVIMIPTERVRQQLSAIMGRTDMIRYRISQNEHILAGDEDVFAIRNAAVRLKDLCDEAEGCSALPPSPVLIEPGQVVRIEVPPMPPLKVELLCSFCGGPAVGLSLSPLHEKPASYCRSCIAAECERVRAAEIAKTSGGKA